MRKSSGIIVVLGACVTHADIEDGRVPDVDQWRHARVAAGIAYRAVRNRGTIGGSLTNADPSADWVSALSALGAEAVVRGAGRCTNPGGRGLCDRRAGDRTRGE